MPRRLAILMAVTAAATLLAGCSTTPPTTDPTAFPTDTPVVVVPEPTGAPGTTSNVGVTELNLNAQTLSAEIPAGQPLFLRGTVIHQADGWTATLTPATPESQDAVIFTNGGTNADGTSSDPALQGMKPGKVIVTLVNSADPATTITIYVTVTTSNAYENSGEVILEDNEPLTIKEQATAFAKTVIGMKEDAANKAIYNGGFQARVVERDGESTPATSDYVETRLNLTIVKGTVKKATVG